METKPEMTDLPSHSYFEQLLGRGEPTEEPLPSFVVIYFTATWCGKCKTLDLPVIISSVPDAVWYKNDIDKNEQTYAYSVLRSIPSFVVIKNKKYMGKYDIEVAKERKEKITQETIITWLKQFI
jgi:thiol-disulfide isomerase/thioredoxin